MNHSSEADKVFHLSEYENSKIEFKKNMFFLHSHKEGVKPIILNKADMKKLLNCLPSFIEESNKIMKKQWANENDGDDDGNDLPKSKKAKPISDGESGDDGDDESKDKMPRRKKAKMNSETEDFPLSIENKTWKTTTISKFKQFETRLTINTWNDTAYIWLKLFFNPAFDAENSTPSKTRKRKQSEEKMLPAKGGIIFNDVNMSKLFKYVNKQC